MRSLPESHALVSFHQRELYGHGPARLLLIHIYFALRNRPSPLHLSCGSLPKPLHRTRRMPLPLASPLGVYVHVVVPERECKTSVWLVLPKTTDARKHSSRISIPTISAVSTRNCWQTRPSPASQPACTGTKSSSTARCVPSTTRAPPAPMATTGAMSTTFLAEANAAAQGPCSSSLRPALIHRPGSLNLIPLLRWPIHRQRHCPVQLR